MQTSTDVTKQPDALEASGTLFGYLFAGGLSGSRAVSPSATFVVVGDGLKQIVWAAQAS